MEKLPLKVIPVKISKKPVKRSESCAKFLTVQQKEKVFSVMQNGSSIEYFHSLRQSMRAR